MKHIFLMMLLVLASPMHGQTAQFGNRGVTSIVPVGNFTSRTKIIDLTVTGTNWTSDYAKGFSYVDSNGQYRLVFNLDGSVSSAITAFDGAITGITSIADRQAITATAIEAGVGGKVVKTAIVNGSSNTFTVQTDGGVFGDLAISGDILLASKPTWFDANVENQPSVSAYIPEATSSQAGIVGTGVQTFGGNKTFISNIGIGSLLTNTKFGVTGDTDTSSQYTIRAENNSGFGVFSVLNNGESDFRDASGNLSMRVASNGDVGIGGAPSTKLDVGGSIHASQGLYIAAITDNNLVDNASNGSGSTTMYIGNAAIQVSSDKRVKTNIVDSKFHALEALNKLEVKDFEWNDPTDSSYNNRNARGKWTGVIAQQVVEHIPFMVNAPREKDTLKIDHKSAQRWYLDTGAAIGVFIKAFQELKAENNLMKAWICQQADAPEQLCGN